MAEPVAAYRGPPLLAVVVDAEEEFEWAEPLAPQHRGTVSIRAQRSAHTLFAHYGIKPTYLVTYPLAAEDSAIGVLREYLADGLCEIGAQLHPWVTPPFTSGVIETQSYPGNLPVAIEREKLSRLVGAIETAFALRPTAYKAGRYGFGPNTAALLEASGFEVDTSLIPRTSYADSGGPEFSGYDYNPFWFGHHRRLLELPVTRALTGVLARRWPWLHQRAERRPWRALHAGGLLSRAGLIERITLSPEGSDLAAMCRLTRVLLARGTRVLTLSSHSPSLEPGHTPYVRNERDLAIFLDDLSGFLSFFRDEIGGEFLTIHELRQRLSGDGSAGVAPTPQAARPKRCGPMRCGPMRCGPVRLGRVWCRLPASAAWWWPTPSPRCTAARRWSMTAWRASAMAASPSWRRGRTIVSAGRSASGGSSTAPHRSACIASICCAPGCWTRRRRCHGASARRCAMSPSASICCVR
jgi:hypothetical protein